MTKKRKREIAEAFRNLKGIPVVETLDGAVYFRFNEQTGEMEYGGACNVGLLRSGAIPYDDDYDLDWNLQAIVEEIHDRYGNAEEGEI